MQRVQDKAILTEPAMKPKFPIRYGLLTRAVFATHTNMFRNMEQLHWVGDNTAEKPGNSTHYVSVLLPPG